MGQIENADIFYQARPQIPIKILKKYSQLPLNWEIKKSARSSTVTYQKIHSATQSTLLAPKNLAEMPIKELVGSLKFEQKLLTHNETYVVKIPEGRVWGSTSNQGVILTQNNQVLTDISVGSSHLIASAISTLSDPHYIDGTVAVLAPAMGRKVNYIHWMLDNLPRLELIRLAGIDWSSIDYFVLQRADVSFYRSSLNKLGIPKEKLIAFQDYPYIQAQRLVVPSILKPHPCHNCAEWAVQFLRKSLTSDLSSQASDSQVLPKRIYIHRDRGQRGIENEAEFFEFLQTFGFQSVRLETKTLDEQIALFANAEAIISVHGAGLTNTVFCQPSTKIIEIFSPFWGMAGCWGISTQLGLDYYAFTSDAPSEELEAFRSAFASLPLNKFFTQFRGPHKMKDLHVDIDRLTNLMQFADIKR